MPSRFRPASLAAALLVTSALPTFAADETTEVWRLFITDQQAGRVTALDATSGETLGVFPTTGYVTHLKPSESGSILFAVQMDHDMVNVIDSGLRFTSHGDHGDVETSDPALLDLELAGSRPVHIVPHGDEMIQFYDRDGEARVYHEAALLEGDTKHDIFRSAAPVHGVAVPMDKYMLMAEPNLTVETKAGDLPPRLGLSILDETKAQVGDAAVCTGLHGEASSAGMVAFGCAEGVLVAEPQSGAEPKLTMLTYGDDLPDGTVGTLLGAKSMQYFLGNYGDKGVVVIDATAEKPFSLTELPVRRVDFALDPKRVTTAYIFTEDGRIHALDTLSGELSRSTQITDPYSRDGHWRDPRPRLAVIGDEIAITDPRASLVRILDAETFSELRTIEVEGLPFNITAVGGSGLTH